MDNNASGNAPLVAARLAESLFSQVLLECLREPPAGKEISRGISEQISEQRRQIFIALGFGQSGVLVSIYLGCQQLLDEAMDPEKLYFCFYDLATGEGFEEPEGQLHSEWYAIYSARPRWYRLRDRSGVRRLD